MAAAKKPPAKKMKAPKPAEPKLAELKAAEAEPAEHKPPEPRPPEKVRAEAPAGGGGAEAEKGDSAKGDHPVLVLLEGNATPEEILDAILSHVPEGTGKGAGTPARRAHEDEGQPHGSKTGPAE